MSAKEKSQLKCPACGGDFSVSDLLDGDGIVKCLNCGSIYPTNIILQKSDKVLIQELKSNTYERVEIAKQQVEIKKIEDKQKKHEQEKKQENAILKVWLMVGVVAFAMLFLMMLLGYE